MQSLLWLAVSACTEEVSSVATVRFTGRIETWLLPKLPPRLRLPKTVYLTIPGIYIYIYTHMCVCVCVCGPGSSVGIATELRAGRSGIESRWGRDFPPVQTGPGAQPASCKMGTGSFPGVKCSRGVLLTTHLLLVLRSWKSRAMPQPTLWATPGL